MSYWHGTSSKNIEGIREEGLQRNRCGANYSASHGEDGECDPVFLTYGKRRAAYWSQSNEITPADGSEAPAIIKVNSMCIDEDKLRDDPRPTVNKGDLEYHGDISSECISVETPEDDKVEECGKAFERVKNAENEMRHGDNPEALTLFEEAVDDFNHKCDAPYRGGEL